MVDYFWNRWEYYTAVDGDQWKVHHWQWYIWLHMIVFSILPINLSGLLCQSAPSNEKSGKKTSKSVLTRGTNHHQILILFSIILEYTYGWSSDDVYRGTGIGVWFSFGSITHLFNKKKNRVILFKIKHEADSYKLCYSGFRLRV